MSFRAAYMDKARLRSVRAVRAWAMLDKLAARLDAGATDAELAADPLARTVADALELDGADREARLIRMLREGAARTEGNPK